MADVLIRFETSYDLGLFETLRALQVLQDTVERMGRVVSMPITDSEAQIIGAVVVTRMTNFNSVERGELFNYKGTIWTKTGMDSAAVGNTRARFEGTEIVYVEITE